MKKASQNSANVRIQWLHKKIANSYYPNAMRLAERFDISHRQAQRDVDYLKKNPGAPLEYSMEHKGYYYSEQYSLPLVLSSDNDESLSELADNMSGASLQAENTFVQMQIPYTATVEIADKLSVLSLKNFIISKALVLSGNYGKAELTVTLYGIVKSDAVNVALTRRQACSHAGV